MIDILIIFLIFIAIIIIFLIFVVLIFFLIFVAMWVAIFFFVANWVMALGMAFRLKVLVSLMVFLVNRESLRVNMSLRMTKLSKHLSSCLI